MEEFLNQEIAKLNIYYHFQAMIK